MAVCYCLHVCTKQSRKQSHQEKNYVDDCTKKTRESMTRIHQETARMLQQASDSINQVQTHSIIVDFT